MKVLVTGGNGFIGQYVCRRLMQLQHEPLVMDRRFTPMDATGVFSTVFADVRDASAVSESVYHSDAVIHLAGVLGTQESIANPLPAIETNILGSMNVFQACKLHDKKCVYIAVGNHWMNNPYSISKTTAERFALMMNKECGTKIAVVRGMNAYGPGQKARPVRKIIPNFIIPALFQSFQSTPIAERRNDSEYSTSELIVYGDGSQVMDMIYVEDLADILCEALLGADQPLDRPIEAGRGIPTTVDQIAREVIRQCHGGTIKYVPMRPGESVGRPVIAEFPHRLATTSLQDGIRRTIPYYRAQLGLQQKEEALHA